MGLAADWRQGHPGRALASTRAITLSRAYVALFTVVAIASAVRDRLEAVTPPLPLIVDVALVLAYTLITVLWVESVERSARHGGLVPRA